MASQSADLEKSLDNRLLKALVAISIVTGLGVFAYSRSLYYYVQYFWDDLFRDVRSFGEACEVGVGDWLKGDSFQAVLNRPPPLRPMRMPYYSAAPGDKPDVAANQFLYTKCAVDLGVLRKEGFGWMRLHFVHGDSAIFLNGLLKQTIDDLGVAEFPLTPSERLAGSTVVLISRPNVLKTKLLGLPTSMPLIFTDSRLALAKPNFGALFDFTLRPIFWVNEMLVFLLIFAVAWLGGLRREDVAWLVVAVAATAVMDFTLFSKTNSTDPTWKSIGQAFAFAANVALGCFALAFTGSKLGKLRPVALFGLLVGAYTPLCFLPRGAISQAVLLFYIPLTIQCLFFAVVAAMCFRRQGAEQPFESPRRLIFVAWFCALLAIARLVDLLLYRQLGFTFAEAISEVGFTGFCTFLIVDLVVSYRRYLAEKVLRAQSEARSREFEAVARVTQMLAHDVRKPYQSLLNGLKILDAAIEKGEGSGAAKRVRSEVERALGETNAMLSDVMDMGAKKSQLSGDVDVTTTADDCVRRAMELNQRQGIRIEHQWKGPTRLSVDPRRFQRVLMNLIENAVQAVPADGTLRIETSPETLGDKPAMRLTIWNSGSFIPETEKETIFDPFFTKKSKGTGLGLAIVKKFVEAEGGRIECASIVGEGTSFSLIMPVPVGGSPGRLALIDDDVFVREIWQAVGGGWQVEVFDGPASFWKAVAERKDFLNSFDVIMTDYYFGKDEEGTGDAFARALKGASDALPVVLFSDVRLSDAEMAPFDGQIAKGEAPSVELLARYTRH